MADIKKDVLNKLRPYLCTKIRAERHFDYLRSRQIMTRDDAEEITSLPTHNKKTSALLDILSDNPCGLDALMESVQLSRCQNFIIAKITDEVQKAKNEKIEALRGFHCSTNNLGVYRPTTGADFSRTYSEDSTMLYHPEGEGSPCASDLPGSLDLKSLQKGGGASSMTGWNMPSSSSSLAPSTLPGPGDPGAPALPDEVLDQMEETEPLLGPRLEERPPVKSPHPRWKTDKQVCEVEDFRRRLKYFFMNPCEKYRARGRKPWKLTLQILKIAIITIQLVSFGLSNEMMVTFKEESLGTFKHLFLKGFTDQHRGTYALYTQTDVYHHIRYAVDRYLDLQNLTVGNHAYGRVGGLYTPLSLCREFYRNASIFPGNETFDIDPHVDRVCIAIYPTVDNDSLARLLNFSLDFKRAINLQTVQHHELPDCYFFNITIMFNNHAHSGRIKTEMMNDVGIYECKDMNVAGTSGKNDCLLLMMDSVVMVACVASLVLCSRSIRNGLTLQFECNAFFQTSFGKTVPWSDRMEFVNGWYILIIVSDTLTIAGSMLKIGIQTKYLTNYDGCSILLGTATMLVWVGVVRYLGFFKKYNILILTLRAAFPNVIRFSCCAAMIYLGYCFCGWIVLGPYHYKFRTLDKVTECLFSLINGDDMYATFKEMRDKTYMIWLFSRSCQEDKTAASQLQAFIAECRDQPESGRYNLTDNQTASGCCCFG
ncbi:hypothetical protein NHX12_004951 [Muraenolepis orangiensis]|uniref:CARD domain-containing protein n=1 Tax=Muraenolepis orangiensis TaxID=630683 RepID=A0A9Q0IF33_9TELE|nr:hypothetical protein NHX12_004951 [Muraenolepis orangiensis]